MKANVQANVKANVEANVKANVKANVESSMSRGSRACEIGACTFSFSKIGRPNDIDFSLIYLLFCLLVSVHFLVS